MNKEVKMNRKRLMPSPLFVSFPRKRESMSSVIPAPAGIQVLLLLVFLTGFVFAQTQPAGAVSAVDLMVSTSGARAQALGQAGVALSQGVFAPFWNPAALELAKIGDHTGVQVGSHYAKLYGEVDRFTLAAGIPWNNFSFDLNYVSESVGDIPLTSEDADGRPVLEGSFSDTKTVLAGTVSSTVINDNFRVGGTVKMVKHALYLQSVSSFGFDLGATYQFTDQITLGAAVRNLLQPKLKWASGYTDTFARRLDAGGAYNFAIAEKPVTVAAQIGYEQGSGTDYGLGVEFSLVNWLPIRLGLDKQSLTGGLGLTFGQFVLDYAYRGNSDLGASHQVSLEVRF